MKDYSTPAFPTALYARNSIGDLVMREQYSGMSLRDYIAIHATNEDIKSFYEPREHSSNSVAIAFARYKYADAMLIERGK